MSERTSLFKRMDTELFKLIEQFKGQSFYIKLQEQISALDEEVLSFVQYISFAILVFIPMLVLMGFFLHNSGLKDNLKLKQDVYSMASRVLSTEKELKKFSLKNFDPGAPLPNGGLRNKVQSAQNFAGIESAKIKLSQYEADENAFPAFAKTAIRFTEVSTAQLLSFLENLSLRQKLHITELDVQKSSRSKLLSGTLLGTHYVQGAQE